jgi:hypothetical protein
MTSLPHLTLRLVPGDPAPSRRAALRPATGAEAALRLAERRAAEDRVARANAASVTLSALDPRWVLAVAVSREVQGGRAAVLTPESRRRLIGAGGRLGLRPFDANLVIAIVQDAARSGADPLDRDVVARLHLVGADRGQHPELADARPAPTWRQMLAWLAGAAALGSGLTLLAVRLLG